jgi:hypothetical protein
MNHGAAQNQTIDITAQGLDAVRSARLEIDWMSVHERLTKLAKTKAGLDYEEARLILEAKLSNLHKKLGRGSLLEYLDSVFGYGPKVAFDRIRVAEAIERLPEIGEALRLGVLSWSAVRELTRVAKAETERAWIDAARNKTIREVEDLVSGRAPGDRPSDPPRSELKKHILKLEVSAETMATWREAAGQIRKDAGEALDDDAVVKMMARFVLGGPSDEGRASYQIAIVRCPDCRRTSQLGGGERIDLDPETIEKAECDTQRIEIDAPRAAEAEAAAGDEGGRGGGGGGGGGSSETSDDRGDERLAAERRTLERATQDIPPAIRRLVMRRDGGRCVVPGCAHHRFLDAHHTVLRSEGGDHDPDLIVTLCVAHHDAVHAGRLVISGRVSMGLTFAHSDGTPYGAELSPERVQIFTDAFQALVGLGYRQGDSKRALDVARPHVGTEATFASVMTRALAALRSERARSE